VDVWETSEGFRDVIREVVNGDAAPVLEREVMLEREAVGGKINALAAEVH